MFNEDNQEGGKCSQCGGMGGKMGMWMHMPKDVKLAKLEMKKTMMEAELEFIGKMIERTKKMPEDKK